MASYLSVLIQAAEPANYKLNYDEHYMLSVPLATTTTPGVAAFDSDYFVVENGVVKINPDYDGELANKVDKIVPEDTGIFAYVVRKVMGQVIDYAIEISQDADADTIAMRYTDGRLKIGNGVDNADAVNKGQLTDAMTDIPKSALASDVRTSLGKADTAVQAPVPKTDLATAVQTSLGKADTAVQAPIPETDLSTDVRTKLNKAISRVGITPEAWQALPVADRDINTMYFVGPYGEEPNQYFVEWMYFVNNGVGTWEAIGSTLAVDLSDYFTKSEINALLAGKANIDGVYSGMSVGHANTADEANSLKTSLGVTDETPTAMQPVGGTSDVTTTYQKLNKLVGCKVVKNQLVQNGDFSDGTTGWYGYAISDLSASNNEASFTVTSTTSYGSDFYNDAVPFSSGHTYFVSFLAKVNDTSKLTGMRLRNPSIISFGDSVGTAYTFVCFVVSPSENGHRLNIQTGSTDGTLVASFKRFQVSDLTLRYGNNDVVNAIIGNDSSKYVEKLLAFDPNILVDTAYDTGSFSMCKSATLRTVDYNQWDEEWENGGYNHTTGEKTNTVLTVIRCKNPIPVLPNRQYYINVSAYVHFYDASGAYLSYINDQPIFTTPSNCRFICFNTSVAYPSTYGHDIFLILYWDGSRIGYEPYSAHDYTLPNKDLNGILTVKDGKVVADGDELYPSGEGNATSYAEVDLGTLDWERLGSSYPNTFLASLTGQVEDDSTVWSRITAPYSYSSNAATEMPDKTYRLANSLRVHDSSYSDVATFKAAMSGVKLIYKIATPTALTAPTFPAPFYGDDFGVMFFLDEDGNVIDGLQGNEIFYKANVAGFAESLYSEAEGDPAYFEAAGDVPTDITNYLKGLTGYDATKTQTLKNVTGTLTWVDDV